MKDNSRANEIFSKITAFSKDSYTKEEYLPELFKLQQEIVHLTYNGDHANHADLRLWDVERHLRKMNEERGYIVDEELDKLIKWDKVICNAIKAEVSGMSGERKVFNMLENISCNNKILKNVEFEFEGKRTEIDAIVFTNKAIFIIEIKNSKKNIFIDESGDFFRIGNSMHFDCNIANKMHEREMMLRKALERTSIDNHKIYNIIAFTNYHIDVENKCRYIKVCGSNYLPLFIDNFKGGSIYSNENICTMMEAVTECKCKEAYQMQIDMNEYKENFSRLMSALESYEIPDNDSEDAEISDEQPYVIPNDNESINEHTSDIQKESIESKIVSLITSVAAVGLIIAGLNKLLRK